MNQKESLELFEQGENAWNTWANNLLDDKADLESAGIWMGEDRNQWNEESRSWHESAKADFSNYKFTSNVDFRNFIFPGYALFTLTNFQRPAKFERAEFHYNADFWKVRFKHFTDFSNVMFLNNATFDFTKFGHATFFRSTYFKGIASFRGATFSDQVSFKNTKFKSAANFLEATFFRPVSFHSTEFEDVAQFVQCSFESAVNFGDSYFKKFASFKAVSGKGLFYLHNVKFINVPDFAEAHFQEAPQFDNVGLKPERFKELQAHETSPNIPSRWRALRRLAIQAHDHERELQFFKGEIIARRGTEDKLTHARYWFGWLYQLLSDFGRSMGLPLLWFGISLLLFAIFYACQGPVEFNQLLIKHVSCIDGSGDSRIVALGVSTINAFPFAAISSSDLLNQYYACLYGIQENTLVIPYVVTFVSIIQFFVSAVLLFLFLLAVRNNFRIK